MSEVKVNKISPRTACGTVTLGDSGDTFTIPSGATINNQGTAVNFGATGSASWVTTVKTSSPFTAVAGEGYFVNTTSGPITVNLPAGTPGAVVAIKDYANTFDTNACTLVQNGSDKIGGSTVNSDLTIEGLAVTLVFIDSTQGWLVTDSGLQSEAPGAQYIVATGGTITTSPCGNFKIHSFTGPGTFCVSQVGNPSGSTSIQTVLVAGGGGGGDDYGGGGGAGGYIDKTPSATPITVQGYPIAVGGGGAGGTGGAKGANGVNSTGFSLTTIGGGGGGGGSGGENAGTPGGSGGGARGNRSPTTQQGSGTQPSQPGNSGTFGFGNNGGPGATPSCFSGSGGGAGAVGNPAASAAAGAVGKTSDITGSPLSYAGGGAGNCGAASPCGTGGAGTGGAGTTNRGGGAGGSPSSGGGGGTGGSGIVIIKYKFQN